MKRNWKNNAALFVFVFILLTACNRVADHADHETYTCPMHPTVISEKPGTCPVCGMDLVRKSVSGEEAEITREISDVAKAPNQSVVSAIKTVNPVYKSLPSLVKAVGVVTYDTRKIYSIPTRVAGRVEKMYVKYEFQPVKKGDKVAEIYSPELVAAQRELLYLIDTDPSNAALTNGAKNKLMRMGISASHIEDLIRSKEPRNTFSVYSPYDGYAIKGTTRPPALSSNKDDMNSMSSPAGTSVQPGSNPSVSTLEVREGTYISAGQALISIVNTDAIRIELDFPQEISGQIKQGDKLEIDIGNETHEQAVVDLVQPFFTENQNFLKVRVNIRNRDLHIGQLVATHVNFKARESLWVPRQSVVDLGINKVVFVKERETFRPTKVVTGISSGDWLEIKSGLATSDQIASDAHYLVDSESFVKTPK